MLFAKLISFTSGFLYLTVLVIYMLLTAIFQQEQPTKSLLFDLFFAITIESIPIFLNFGYFVYLIRKEALGENDADSLNFSILLAFIPIVFVILIFLI